MRQVSAVWLVAYHAANNVENLQSLEKPKQAFAKATAFVSSFEIALTTNETILNWAHLIQHNAHQTPTSVPLLHATLLARESRAGARPDVAGDPGGGCCWAVASKISRQI